MSKSGTDISLLKKGISNLIMALPLMFLGPYLITLGFLNKENFMLYVFLILGIGAAVTGVYFAYRGINVIIESMFGKKKK